ncbi:hypothetical protein [Mycolicibacterium mengxianglii]|uniref:hypothetical protein n=1 Tax=Mycolicibacterium mengxianglii TaxID=2736649 RepID=UPI0018CFFB98|nr:hypothetical protein [Mycolicibacterium mengxianglii]
MDRSRCPRRLPRDRVHQIGSDPLRWPVVTVTAEQHRDGRLGVIDVDVDARAGLTPDQARQLAALLIAGAALAEEWVR